MPPDDPVERVCLVVQRFQAEACWRVLPGFSPQGQSAVLPVFSSTGRQLDLAQDHAAGPAEAAPHWVPAVRRKMVGTQMAC